MLPACTNSSARLTDSRISSVGLNASGTAVMGRPVVLIDDPAGDAMPIQFSRHEQARWTCAHHHLDVSGHQDVLGHSVIGR